MQPIAWERESQIPPGAAAVLSALQFGNDSGDDSLQHLTAAEWQRTLEFCDRAQLRILLGNVAEQRLPEAIRDQLRQDTLRHVERIANLRRAFAEIIQRLQGS